MPKIETPTSVRLYVQWVLHPFQNPQIHEQESENSEWALEQAKELLNDNYIDEEEVKLVKNLNGLIQMEILTPQKQLASNREFWEYFLSILQACENIESISVFVNNDISHKIAFKLADLVNRPWYQGYQGYNKSTLIYHK